MKISAVQLALCALFACCFASAEQGALSARAIGSGDRQLNDEYRFLRDQMRVSLVRPRSDSAPRWQLTEWDREWLREIDRRLLGVLPASSVLRSDSMREDFLRAVLYESRRAGLDPQWVLAVIEVESAFRKHALSSAGAHGYMQVMPFWRDLIGERGHNLFYLRTNLRYGTVILRHYLDIERGSYYGALGRYNGSLGKSGYPESVLRAWRRHWALN